MKGSTICTKKMSGYSIVLTSNTVAVQSHV